MDDVKDNVYMMAVINYALTLANSDKRSAAMAHLQPKKIESDGILFQFQFINFPQKILEEAGRLVSSTISILVSFL